MHVPAPRRMADGDAAGWSGGGSGGLSGDGARALWDGSFALEGGIGILRGAPTSPRRANRRVTRPAPVPDRGLLAPFGGSRDPSSPSIRVRAPAPHQRSRSERLPCP